MNQEIKLKSYLLKKFFIVLIFVGLAEAIMDQCMRIFGTPLLDRFLSLDGLLTESDIQKTFYALFLNLLIFAAQKYTSSVSYMSRIAFDQYLATKMDASTLEVLSTRTDKLSGAQTWIYMLGILFAFLFVALIWLLPYIIGGIYYSVTVHRKINEIEAARIAKEKEYEQQRNLLLSDVAHDIKTPITTVAGFSKALADGDIAEDGQQQYLDAIYHKSMQVSNLVSLLFEYVKLDSSGYTLQKTTEDLCELVRGCIARLYTDFEEKNMDLDISIPEEEIYLQVDKTQFERAINNLLVNTIKHNPEETKVMINLQKKEQEIIIEISDLGVFIETETARHLFDPFVQGDRSRTSGSGNGLGLSICKKIIEMHQGKIVLIQYKRPELYGRVKTFEIKLPVR